MKKNRKTIACFGFSADPPHIGHLQIARLILSQKLADQVWFIPCFKHPCLKTLSPPEHRLKLAKLLEGKGIKVSDIEYRLGGKSYTINTLRRLKKDFPNIRFLWIMGSDIIKSKSYEKWKNWEKLSLLTKFLVVKRKGFDIENLPPGFFWVKSWINDVSSTKIRERVRRGLSIAGLVTPRVKKYIKKYGLYE